MEDNSFLKSKHILVVDNEWDIVEIIQDVLTEATLDITRDHKTALEKIIGTQYDLALLDIMETHGIELLEECVKRDIPAVILITVTAPPQILMSAVKKGAISYLAKKYVDRLPKLIHDLFNAQNEGNPTWKLMFKKLKDFNHSFKDSPKNINDDTNGDFWIKFEKEWDVSKGIQERLLHNKNIVDKGI